MYSLDYSRFDHIGDSDDSSQASTVEPPAEEEAPSAEPAGAGVARAIADALNPRLPDAIVLCVHAFLPCARCGASMADGGCRVPHPPHLLVDTGSAFGSGESRKSHSCRACGQDYTMVSRLGRGRQRAGRAALRVRDSPLLLGRPHARPARSGRRAPRVARPGGRRRGRGRPGRDRRARRGRAAREGPLGAMVRRLDHADVRPAARAARGAPAHRRRVPPRRADPGDDAGAAGASRCRTCPRTARSACAARSCARWRSGTIRATRAGSRRCSTTRPSCAPSTRSKLQRARQLQFAGPELELIDLHRTDCLGALSVWAPTSRHLGLQAAKVLEVLEFPETHPVYHRARAASHVPTPFGVNTMNSCLGEAAKNALRANPRARRAAAAHRGMPTRRVRQRHRRHVGGRRVPGDTNK